MGEKLKTGETGKWKIITFATNEYHIGMTIC